MTPDPNPFPHIKVVDMNKLKLAIAGLIVWLKAEPVVTRVAAALAVTALAREGVHLSADQTLAVSIVASAIAARAARRKVTPKHLIPAAKPARTRKKTAPA